MSGEERTWDVINANRAKLRNEVNLNDLLLNLSSRGVFSTHEETRIREKDDITRRFDEFFFTLFHKNPQRHLDDFFQALNEIGRDDVAGFLQGANGQRQQEGMKFIESRRRLLEGIPVHKVCQKLGRLLTQEDVTFISSDSGTGLTNLLDTLCNKSLRYEEWYLDLLVALQDLTLMSRAEELESKTDLNARIGRVMVNFIKIGNPDEVTKRMTAHGILNNDEVGSLNKNIYNVQKMSCLGNVLGSKKGRNLPLICRCLLESGYRSIAEDLLHSSEEELMKYTAGSDMDVYGGTMLLSMREERRSLEECIEQLKGVVDNLSGERNSEERMGQIFDQTKVISKNVDKLLEKHTGETALLPQILLQLQSNDIEKKEQMKALEERLQEMSMTLAKEEGLKAKHEKRSKKLERQLERQQNFMQQKETELNETKAKMKETSKQMETLSNSLEEAEERTSHVSELKTRLEAQNNEIQEQLQREQSLRVESLCLELF
ncbi:unnamed protein product [Darwinula stevensoni]|uniref:CARD domain-containing protein n=1 Tax=Darwinula stevensoni TaxID=69355 RepID=A0A7R9A4K3_9CRUS|nr:unnamed protein product [Darwinula stevensoni]CAG0884450.1 unnamed protein product [Darwinula stevensoni]